LFWEVGCGKGVGSTLPTEADGGMSPNHRYVDLILLVEICVKRLFQLGKGFPWPRPERCPRCLGRLWGHGFCPAYFDGFHEPLWLRRYRCPSCRLVLRLRPQGYWSRFQASIATIRESLARRLIEGRWLPWLPRSRQRHWLKGLWRQIRLHMGFGWRGDLLEAFDLIQARGIAAASSGIQCESPTIRD